MLFEIVLPYIDAIIYLDCKGNGLRTLDQSTKLLTDLTIGRHSLHLGVMSLRSSYREVFLGKASLKICSKFTGKHPCQSVILIKLLCNFIEITLQYGCSFSCKFAAYFQNTFSQEHVCNSARYFFVQVTVK